MSDLPHPWGAYQRLQEKLLRKDRLDAEAWGFEAALTAIVDAVTTDMTLAQAEIERAANTAARSERYRAYLRFAHLQSDEPTDDGGVIRAIEANQILARVAENVPSDDWDLLRDVAEGRDYETLSRERGVTPGSLRVKVVRLRASLMHLAV